MNKIIRPMREEDYGFVEEISEATWDGEDYLHTVFHFWLEDGNFYALEIDGRVAGTVKLTILPDRVAWLEGLRVHPDYRGRGYGRELHDFIVSVGKRMRDEGKTNFIEFATHLHNYKSRKMAEKMGFKVVKRYYFSFLERMEGAKFENSELNSLDEIGCSDYIPYGWKFLHCGEEALNWLNENAGIGKIGDYKFIYPLKNTEPSFFPLNPEEEALRKIVKAMSYYAEKMGKEHVATMVPEEEKKLLKTLQALGFQSVVDFSVPDVLVYRL